MICDITLCYTLVTNSNLFLTVPYPKTSVKLNFTAPVKDVGEW